MTLRQQAKQEAKKLVKSFVDIVRIDHTYDEEPIFEYQKQAAHVVVDKMFEVTRSGEWDYWKIVKEEIDKLKK